MARGVQTWYHGWVATGATPNTPRPLRAEWWQKNDVSLDPKDVTDLCFHCGHTRDLHTVGQCHAMATWNQPTSRSCLCQNPGTYWVKAQIKGVDIASDD